MSDSRADYQYRMSVRLKIVAVAIGVIGAVFFAAVFSVKGYLARELLGHYDLVSFSVSVPARIYTAAGMIFTAVVMAGCYKILWHFWGVCTEIGRDNSFSAENAQLFKRMSRTSAGCAACYGISLMLSLFNLAADYPLYRLIAGTNRTEMELYNWVGLGAYGLMLVLFILFAVLASALSELVRRASEVQAENDLTI